MQIDDENLDFGQRRGRGQERLEAVTIEAGHWQAGARVALAGHADHVLGLAANPVLGTEQAAEPDLGGRQRVDDVAHAAVHARGMAEHAHAPAGQQIESFPEENLQAGLDHRKATRF